MIFWWDGERFEPLDIYRDKANEQFVVGQRYSLEPIERRSLATHNHYFASLHDLWQHLPERLAVKFPTVEELRRHALIMTGYRNEKSFVASSPKEAQRIAAFIENDPGAYISVNENVVVVWTAKSQSYKSMSKAEFGRSKNAVLQYVTDIVSGEQNENDQRLYL